MSRNAAKIHNELAKFHQQTAERLDRSERDISTEKQRDARLVADFAPVAIGSGYDLSPIARITGGSDGNAHAVARAVTNLIGNAIAYGGSRGSITVRVGASRTIDVQDEGPGVPSNLQPRLLSHSLGRARAMKVAA